MCLCFYSVYVFIISFFLLVSNKKVDEVATEIKQRGAKRERMEGERERGCEREGGGVITR